METYGLEKLGITGATEVVRNPSFEYLFEAEMDPALEGFDKGQMTELGAVNVMTGIYTGRSPKDKFIDKHYCKPKPNFNQPILPAVGKKEGKFFGKSTNFSGGRAK